MIYIKICGITNLCDAKFISLFEPDAMGFVFTNSPRKIMPERARKIIKSIPTFITSVGVFMNQKISEVNEIADFTGIDVIQLHGKEDENYCQKLNRRVIKRIDIKKGDSAESLGKKMENFKVSSFLLDPGRGSGKIFKWSLTENLSKRFIVAGGLNPENVKEAIKITNPYGVDVSSGVEKEPGKKDMVRVERFIREVRSC